MSCGVGHRRSSDLVLLLLWRSQVAVAPIRPLAWETLYAVSAALKKKKKKKRIPKKSQFSESPLYQIKFLILLPWYAVILGQPSTGTLLSQSRKNFPDPWWFLLITFIYLAENLHLSSLYSELSPLLLPYYKTLIAVFHLEWNLPYSKSIIDFFLKQHQPVHICIQKWHVTSKAGLYCFLLLLFHVVLIVWWTELFSFVSKL